MSQLWTYVDGLRAQRSINGRAAACAPEKKRLVPHSGSALNTVPEESATSPNRVYSLMITSALRGEGKSTTAINLAVAAARRGNRTLLIDGDIERRGSLYRTLAKMMETRLVAKKNVEIRGGQWKLRVDALSPLGTSFSGSTANNNLRVLTVVQPLEEADVFWSSTVLDALLTHLHGHADFVVVDAPPLLETADASNIASRVEGTLLCVHSGRTPRRAIMRAQKALARSGACLVGSILNQKHLRRGGLFE